MPKFLFLIVEVSMKETFGFFQHPQCYIDLILCSAQRRSAEALGLLRGAKGAKSSTKQIAALPPYHFQG
jgi:hypothetical protein